MLCRASRASSSATSAGGDGGASASTITLVVAEAEPQRRIAVIACNACDGDRSRLRAARVQPGCGVSSDSVPAVAL